jgi:uncharacterized protein (DUF1697 family)
VTLGRRRRSSRYGPAVASSPTRYVALLRGINVGKARQIGMPRLAEVLTAGGHANVRTHLRSGNVVLDSALAEAELVADLEKAIEKEFGFAVPVVVRTGAELEKVIASNPFAELATDPARYLVTFLPEPPSRAAVAGLPPVEDGGGEYLVRGRELYLWLPDGIANTPLAAWKWDRLLGVAGTGRNWNTVTKLGELSSGSPTRG